MRPGRRDLDSNESVDIFAMASVLILAQLLKFGTPDAISQRLINALHLASEKPAHDCHHEGEHRDSRLGIGEKFIHSLARLLDVFLRDVECLHNRGVRHLEQGFGCLIGGSFGRFPAANKALD